jgi:hypothetical protein
MKRKCIFIPALILIVAVSFCHAADKFDPAARASAIAPYIDEQTFAIVHIDISRLKIDVITDTLINLIPEEKEEILKGKAEVTGIFESFLKAGGKDFYVGIRAIIPTPGGEVVYLIVPIDQNADQQAIEKCKIFDDVKFKRNGNVLIGSGRPEEIARLEKITADPRPELTAAFETAGDTPVQVLLLPPKYAKRVIEETMPQLPQEIGGGPSSIVTNGCRWAALGVDFIPQLNAKLVIQSQDDASAAALSEYCIHLLNIAAKLPPVQQLVPKFSDSIPDLTPKTEGDRLVLVIDQQKKELFNMIGAVQSAMFMEARTGAIQTQSVNHLKQMGLAMHVYHDANKHFPAAASYSKDGKPLLSWRVMLLPLLGQKQLYNQFHLDEPWDSPNNKSLIDKMPAVFKSPKSAIKEPGKTNYVVPVGPGTLFEDRNGIPLKNVKDGAGYTIMAVVVDDDHAVIWTKPDDLQYDPKNPAKGLGKLFQGVFIALFADGSCRKISLPRPDDELRAAFSINGGESAPQF